MPKAFSSPLEIFDPKHQRAIQERARRLRRRMGEVAPGERLPRISPNDACLIVDRYEADLQEARKRDAAVIAARRAEAPPPQRPTRAAYMRRRRLLALAPEGATADVWAEIVNHFKCTCAYTGCIKGACRVARLDDGTPVPACVEHAHALQACNVQGGAT